MLVLTILSFFLGTVYASSSNADDNSKAEPKNSSVINYDSSNEGQKLYTDAKSIIENTSASTNELNEAIVLLQNSLEKGHQRSSLELAQLYYFGHENFEPDYKKSLRYLEQCREAECHYLHGLFYWNALGGRERSVTHALAFWSVAARRGNHGASLALANLYSQGSSVEKNCYKARDFYFSVAVDVAEEMEKVRVVTFPKNSRLSFSAKEKPAQNAQDVVEFYQYSNPSSEESTSLFLGHVFNGAIGVPRDVKMARYYYEQGASAGNMACVGHLGLLDYFGEGIEKPNYRAAYHAFRRASKEKNAAGLLGMGLLYWKGIEVERDREEAVKYLTEAANLEPGEANYYLGLVLTELDSVLNEDRIFSTYLAGIRAGHALCTYELAKLNMLRDANCNLARHLLSSFIEKMPELIRNDEAVNLFESGKTTRSLSVFMYYAMQGFEMAQFNAAFALEYMAKKGGRTDDGLLKRALMYWSMAAEKGDGKSLIKVGDYFFYGWGIKAPVHVTAAAYYHKAVEKKLPQAAFNMGFMYHNGLGVDKDLKMARRYYGLSVTFEPDIWIPGEIALLGIDVIEAINHFEKRLAKVPVNSIKYALLIVFTSTFLMLSVLRYGFGRRNHNVVQAVPRNGEDTLDNEVIVVEDEEVREMVYTESSEIPVGIRRRNIIDTQEPVE